MTDWYMCWPDRRAFQRCIAYRGYDCRINAVVSIPRHRETWHVVIWDEHDLDCNITDTEMIINHPGWTDANEAKEWAKRYLILIKASEAGDA